MRTHFLLLPVFLLLITLSCKVSDSDSEPSVITTDRYTIVNDESLLNERVTEYTTDTEIIVDTTKAYNVSAKVAPPKFNMYLKSEVSSPSAGGEQVQATMVSTDGSSRTIISYNFRGAPYLGGLDIAQVTGNGNIRIRSGITFNDTDVNAFSASNTRIYTAISTSNPDFITDGNASSVQGLEYTSFQFTGTENYSAPVPSFAANSSAFFNNRVYVTSGNTGGLSIFNEDLTQQLAYLEIPEARWVAVNDQYLVVLSGDTNDDGFGELRIIDQNTFQITQTYSFPGADTPEAKNTVELVNHLAFIAAGKSGVQIMDLTTGSVLETIPRPDPASLGLTDDVVETNAVTVDEDIIFISNGEAGVYVAEAAQNLDLYNPGESPSIAVLGKLQFDELQSVNHVSYKNKIFTVAAGLGGVKSLELRIK